MKRLMAIFLAAIILLSSFEPVVAAEKSTAESKKIKWLLENNFIVGRGQSKDLKLEDTITRAEFTRMVLASKGEENLAKEDSTFKADFKDVPESHWAEKFIAYAKEKGYISGYPDGNFRPEGKITYEEIISILSRIHPNYRKIETSSTNWAEGFINFAKDNGILDEINIKGSYQSPAIREKTFEMIYNFIKFVENQTKSEEVSKIKEEKDVKKEYSTWNGFYPYWLGYGFRPSEEEKPNVKPNPDVKPAPDKPEEPEKPEKEDPGTEPEAPKEFDKTKMDKVEILNQPSKLEYTEGEKLDLSGIKLNLTDAQGIVKGVVLGDFGEYGITTDPANESGLSADENGTTIKIKLNGVEKVETDPLKVNEKVFDPAHVEKMVVKEQPTKLNYTDGEKLDLAGLEVRLTDNQGLTRDIPFKDFGTYGITTDPANGDALNTAHNNTKIKIKLNGEEKAETDPLTVKEKELVKIGTDPDSQVPNGYTRIIFDAGEGNTIDGTNRYKVIDVLTGTSWNNAKLTEQIPSSAVPTDKTKEFEKWSEPVPTTGNVEGKEFKAEYKSKEFNASKIEKIEVIAPPTKLTYVVGEKLNLDGLKVKLIDNQGVTNEIGLSEFDDYKITTKPEKDKPLTESDNNTKVIIKMEDTEAITGNISLTLKVISKEYFDKENEIKKNIKNSLVEVYKNLGDLKLGIDNLQNKYYLLFTKDASEINFDKENLKASILNTIKNNKIKSYTIGESTRDLTKSDEEILGFIREDILKIVGLEGTQDITNAQILEKLKETKPNTKIKLVAGDENISFDYEIIFLTQMAEEKIDDIENKFIKVMEETAKKVDQKKVENKKLEVSYIDKHCVTKFSTYLLGYKLSTSVAKGYKDALTSFLTGEEREKTLTLSNLKSVFISTSKINETIVKYGMMERYELEDLLPNKSSLFIYQTAPFHNTFQTNGKDIAVDGKPIDLYKHNTAVEYFYVDKSNKTGGIITRTIHFESIK